MVEVKIVNIFFMILLGFFSACFCFSGGANVTYLNRRESFDLLDVSVFAPVRHRVEKLSRLKSFRKRKAEKNYTWPIKRVAEIEGDVVLGGLMMVHEREDKKICGPIMPQGGIQALECMLYTLDWINNQSDFLPGIKLGSYVLDDCDKDTYGLEQAVDFIKGMRDFNSILAIKRETCFF